jgi:mono/diheme cytochrome c family protein
VIHPADPAAAARGETQLLATAHGTGILPKQGLENLWLVWGTGRPADYWGAFRARYGLSEAPYPNGEYPMGIRAVDASSATFDCLLCHGGSVDGHAVVGLGNTELDLQLLIDDLDALASQYHFAAPQLPSGLTAARGANDAMGMGLALSTQYGPPNPGLHTHLGYQKPPAFWTLAHRHRRYTDGSGDVDGIRTTMAFLLAFGLSESAMEAEEPAFADIHQYLLTLTAPAWPYGAIDAPKAARGQAVYSSTCASCHGVYEGGTFPDHLEPAGAVGTDALRATLYGSAEVSWVNASWFGGNGQAPEAQTATGAYLAPDLTGIWARAPYLHNGSVPTLQALLKSSERPTFFQRTGSDAAAYDPTQVGWRVTVTTTGQEADAPRATRDRTYDTTLPGLSNAGHTYGDSLSDEDRSALLEYLKQL